MHIKIHESYRRVVAFCDSELIGKKFEEEKMQLDVRENFFKGEEISEEQAKARLKSLASDDATFNIVGKRAVDIAQKSGIIDRGNIGKIQGVPFALVLL